MMVVFKAERSPSSVGPPQPILTVEAADIGC
jgi:hypothetical protein